jgi:membrane fusion protein (multidrug efflux system)
MATVLHRTSVRLTLLVFVLAALGAGAAYWYYQRIYVSTDDAYVTGFVGVISARVPGRVARVLVDNNQPVKPGQVLALLEPQDYETAVAQAEANLGRLRQELDTAYVKVATARAHLDQANANFDQAKTDQRRYASLFERKTIARQELDRVNTRFRVNQAEVERAKRQVAESQAAIGGGTDIPVDNQPAIRQAKAQLEQARLNLEYAKITAQVAGYVTRRQVEVGNWVQPGQPLMMVVPLASDQLWIQANYKETQLAGVFIGQPAAVTVDAYPGAKFKGRVDSIMAGTGAAFALLPPENATGNWVKVVQRVPVKIVLSPPYHADKPLRLGMSCLATIDTRERRGPRLLTATASGQ